MKVLDEIRKKYGETSVILGSSNRESIPVIPTGSLTLDLALGVAGFPKGRIIELFGHESSGKTTLSLYAMANCQQLDGNVAFIDTEHALDVNWASTIGVDMSKVAINQSDYGEQALDIAEMLARSGQIDLIVIDSVAALTPKAEIEGEMGDSHMGLQARLMSQAMRKLSSTLKIGNCSIIFTNQIRQKIGNIWGNPETTSGGMALRFYASIRIELKRSSTIKEEGQSLGNEIKFSVVKNKVAAPYQQGTIKLRYGLNNQAIGFDYLEEIIDLSTELGFLDKSGKGWFTIGDKKIQGLANVKAEMDKNPQLFQSLEDKVRIYYGLPIRRFE